MANIPMFLSLTLLGLAVFVVYGRGFKTENR